MTTNQQQTTFTAQQLFDTTVTAIKRTYQQGYYGRNTGAYVVRQPRVSSRDPIIEQRVPMTAEQYDDYYQTRMHWLQLVQKFEVHPSVAKALKDNHIPTSITALVSEWPHISTTDAERLAYSRDDRALREDRQTVTSVGKYLRRHFPQLADHTIRDLVAAYTPDECYIVNTREEMIAGIEFGPRSCMQSGYGSIPFSHDEDHENLLQWSRGDADADDVNWHLHPYAVYCPSLGWSMALRKSEGRIDGRALLWTDPQNPDHRIFVRSYKRSDSGYSQTDEMLEQWLIAQGFVKRDGWKRGSEVLNITYSGSENHDGPMVPYIDGDNNKLTDCGKTLRFSSNGELLCDNTDGTPTVEDEPDWYCEDCDNGYSEDDDHYRVGADEDRRVCSCCIDNYTWVEAHRSNYYIPRNDAVPVVDYRGRHDYCTDPDNLPDGVVELASGDYASAEDCCCIDNAWYLLTDDDVVEIAEECPSTGDRYALRDDAWCDADGAWHSNHLKLQLNGEPA